MPSNPGERASTIKKIDEIEAQMSNQWWKTKHGDSSIRTTNFPGVTSQVGTTSIPLDAPGATPNPIPAGPNLRRCWATRRPPRCPRPSRRR
jgi:hypothetical protein